MKKRSTTVVIVTLTLIMTFMEMTALPSVLFCNVKIKDINPIYITLMLNFLLAFAICWICKKIFIKDWEFGLKFKGVLSGLKKYGLPAVIATALVTIAFCIGLTPFDNKPTIWRVIVEGIVYYIGVGIMEELYLRGLLQNIIKIWFGKRKNATLLCNFNLLCIIWFRTYFWSFGTANCHNNSQNSLGNCTWHIFRGSLCCK